MASGIQGPGGICKWKETGEKNLMTQSAVSVVGTRHYQLIVKLIRHSEVVLPGSPLKALQINKTFHLYFLVETLRRLCF